MGRQALRAPGQGLESSSWRWIAGQGLELKGVFLFSDAGTRASLLHSGDADPGQPPRRVSYTVSDRRTYDFQVCIEDKHIR